MLINYKHTELERTTQNSHQYFLSLIIEAGDIIDVMGRSKTWPHFQCFIHKECTPVLKRSTPIPFQLVFSVQH